MTCCFLMNEAQHWIPSLPQSKSNTVVNVRREETLKVATRSTFRRTEEEREIVKKKQLQEKVWELVEGNWTDEVADDVFHGDLWWPTRRSCTFSVTVSFRKNAINWIVHTCDVFRPQVKKEKKKYLIFTVAATKFIFFFYKLNFSFSTHAWLVLYGGRTVDMYLSPARVPHNRLSGNIPHSSSRGKQWYCCNIYQLPSAPDSSDTTD